MKRAAFVVCAWLLFQAPPGSWAQASTAAPGPSAQELQARRQALLASISKWKVLIPESKDDELRLSFLPDIERIEKEARKPDSDVKDLEKQFVFWKNLFMSELQAAGGYQDSEAFIELERERMRALLTVRQLETKAGAEGVGRISFWKARISGMTDALSLRRLFDNMRVTEGLAQSSGGYGRSSSGSTVYVGASNHIRPEQSEAPPSPRVSSSGAGFDASTFAAIKDYLLARGAKPGVVGQTIQLVWDEVKRYSMDPTLVLALILQESGYNPKAKSPVGAKGMMQIMPGTGHGLGLYGSEFFDPVKNVKAGIKYLAEMLSRFGGDVKKALAAYNAGPGAVEKYHGVPPYQETIGYVKTVYNTYLKLWRLAFD